MSGLIQEFTLVTDSPKSLRHAIEICLVWHRSGAEAFKTGKDHESVPYLTLLWAAPPGVPDVNKLIAHSNDAEVLAMQVDAWLKSIPHEDYNENSYCGGDGDDVRGFKFIGADGPPRAPGAWDNSRLGFYSMFTVQPHWVYYGK